MNDPLTIAKAWGLTAGTSLYTAVGGGSANRISKWVPPSNFKNAAKACVMHIETMTAQADANVQESVLIIKSYGGSMDPDDALSLDRAVYDRFHDAHGDTSSSGGIQKSHLLTSTLTREPNGWPVVVSRYEFVTT